MRSSIIFFILITAFHCNCYAFDTEEDATPLDSDINNKTVLDAENVRISENRLAAQIQAVIEHFKQEDPVGVPGASIADPMDVPDVKKTLTFATLHMQKVRAYGLSKFRITHVKADLNSMKVNADIQLDEMIVKGMYTLSSLFSNAKGPFDVVLEKVLVKGFASLTVQKNGQLIADNIKLDITVGNVKTNFQNLGFLGQVFQGMINSANNLVFDVMKPFMLQEADKELRAEINSNIPKVMGERLLPNSITPLDMAIAELRKPLRRYDPYRLPDYNRTVGVFTMQLANSWLSGISSIYRVGDVVATVDNNTVTITLEVGTEELGGASQWEVDCGLISRIGHVHFTVHHLRVSVSISQALDTRKKPIINDLQIDLGNIQVRCDGAGTLDYILEFAVNVLPNLLRYQIMDAVEGPLKKRLQEQFNTINVEEEILHNFESSDPLNIDYAFHVLGNKLGFN